MIEITNRDRIFVFVALPAAILAAFFFLVHKPQAARLAALRENHEALVPAGDYPVLIRGLERQKAEAEAELAAEKAAPSEVYVRPAVSAAERLHAVLELFERNGAHVSKFSPVTAEARPGTEDYSARLVRAGWCAQPEAWSLELDAAYPDVQATLAAMAQEDLPAMPVSVSLRTDPDKTLGHWTLIIWL